MNKAFASATVNSTYPSPAVICCSEVAAASKHPSQPEAFCSTSPETVTLTRSIQTTAELAASAPCPPGPKRQNTQQKSACPPPSVRQSVTWIHDRNLQLKRGTDSTVCELDAKRHPGVVGISRGPPTRRRRSSIRRSSVNARARPAAPSRHPSWVRRPRGEGSVTPSAATPPRTAAS